jgi:site-specific recombinase XerD
VKKKPITLSQASEAHILAKTAAGKSAYTLRNYRPSVSKLQAHLASDPRLSEITKDQLVGFLAWLRSDHVSDSKSHIRRSKVKLSPKTILNVHTELSALWTWAVKDGYVATNILREIEPPDAKPPVIEVFSEADCHAMIAACDKTSTWRNRALTRSNRGTGDRR